MSPGIGFGEFGDGHVRFAMIENEARTRQAIRGIKQMFREDGLLAERPDAASAMTGADETAASRPARLRHRRQGHLDVLRRNEEEITRRAGRPIRDHLDRRRARSTARATATRGAAGVNLDRRCRRRCSRIRTSTSSSS